MTPHATRVNDRLDCSVIVPAFNVEHYILESIESVLAQTTPPREIIVVDDGSMDGTGAVLSSMRRNDVRLLSQANRGVSAARNAGVRTARGEWVLFLDADDRLVPTALSRFAAVIRPHPEVCAVYGEARIIDDHGRPLGTDAPPVFAPRPSGDVLEALVQQNFVVTTGALCARRARVEGAGLFREDLQLMEDWELWCRLAPLGPFRHMPGPAVVEYRIRPGSLVRSLKDHHTRAWAAISAVYANPALAGRFSAARLAQLRRHAEAAACSFAANQRLRAHDWGAARRCLWDSLRRQPMRPRELLLLLCALAGYVPPPLSSRLK